MTMRIIDQYSPMNTSDTSINLEEDTVQNGIVKIMTEDPLITPVMKIPD